MSDRKAPQQRRGSASLRSASQDAYSRAGVSQRAADSAVEALVRSLKLIETGKPSRVVPLPNHYASVLRIDDRTGVAFGTDGVGTKMLIAERMGDFTTIGIDCIAMNVNDLICVGAEPIAMLDFILCGEADPEVCGAIGVGLRTGAERAGIEIPGGEIAQVGEIVSGVELTGSAIGLVALESIVDGAAVEPGDAIIGLPSSGLHSNGYTLARRALRDVPLDRRPARRGRWARSSWRRPRSTSRRSSSCSARALGVAGARPHHRRRAQQPDPAGGAGRLRDLRSVRGSAGVRADRRAR